MRQGDHLRARRDGGFEHAIDLGDRTVIRWARGRGVERCGYATFAAGAPVEVVVHRERVYRPPLVVARAFSRFAEAAYAGMFASSEQFAVWCKNGQVAGVPDPVPAPRPSRPARKVAARAAAARRAAPGKSKVAPRATARKPARKAAKRLPAPRRAARKAAPRKAAARKVARKPVRRPVPRRPARGKRRR